MKTNEPAEKNFWNIVRETGKNNIEIERTIADGAKTVGEVLDKLSKEKGK